MRAPAVGFECELKELSVHHSGLTRTPEFLAKNPNGRVPMLEYSEGGWLLAESDAILWYLAEETPLVPARGWDRAKCLEWMFFEQYSHEPYVAVTRNIMKCLPKEERAKREHDLPNLIARGNAALAVMETHREERLVRGTRIIPSPTSRCMRTRGKTPPKRERKKPSTLHYRNAVEKSTGGTPGSRQGVDWVVFRRLNYSKKILKRVGRQAAESQKRERPEAQRPTTAASAPWRTEARQNQS